MDSKFHLVRTLIYIKVMSFALALFIFLFPQAGTGKPVQTGKCFTVYANGVRIGVTDSRARITDLYGRARYLLAREQEGFLLLDYPEIVVEEAEAALVKYDSDANMVSSFLEVLRMEAPITLRSAYSVKVNDMVVNVEGTDNLDKILDDTVSQYDEENLFDVNLERGSKRELDVLTANIVRRGAPEAEADPVAGILPCAGAEKYFAAGIVGERSDKEGFEQFELGILDVDFSKEIEIVRAYLPDGKLMSPEHAREVLTKNQETQKIYKVKSGDTLSEISLEVGLPLERIIALNDSLEDEKSAIYVDQELLITVPKPALAVIWTSQERICESYDLDVQYIYNDSWYTNKSVTRQQPSAGYREAIANITYENNAEVSQEILYEEVYDVAVAKVVEVGTQVPPSYIKPIAGGRQTSGFGRRKAPTKGASTYHRGIDWATPVGTPVYASCGGVVAKAGWGSGYGYVVYINHPDGRQTRYGHLSKVKVSAGQTVKQGQVIAASGNTGVSTGPHVHFEILINGSQVNPLSYLN